MQSDTLTSTQSAPSPTRNQSTAFKANLKLWRFSYTMVFLIAVGLLFTNLATTPAPWFDEGLNLGTAATLARQGVYALPDSGGARVVDPAIQTGPLLLVPIALVYQWFGVGILQGRLVMAVSGLLAFGAYALLARRLVGPVAALLALLLLLVGNNQPFTSFIPMARQALGEVTAIGLLMCGLWLWLPVSAQPAPRIWRLVLVGCAFGLAMATKSQILVVFPVAWAAYCLLDRLYYQRASWRAFIVPLAIAFGCVAAWYVVQRSMISAESFARNAMVLRQGVGIHIADLKLQHIRTALSSLWHVGFLFWGLPSLLYGAWLASRRDQDGFAHAGLLIFTLLWLGWYVCLSIGWARYGFVGLAMLPIWAAQGCYDLANGTLASRWLAGSRKRRVLLVGVGVGSLLMFQGIMQLRAIVGPQDQSLGEFAAYLHTHVPADAVVESWEWELDVAATQRFHHPPTQVTNAVTARMTGGAANVQYDPANAQPQYVVDGAFSNWTGLYREFIAAHCEKVTQIGSYTLYKVVR